jgi:uncharacterized phage protein (TIGR01671 family)
MREIKLRGLDRNDGLVKEIERIDFKNEIALFVGEYGWVEFNNVELEQFTGLHDKNGKEIYEGDIVKFDDEVWSSSYTSCGTEYDSYEVVNYGVVGFDEETLRYDFVKYKYNENQVEADLHENHDLEFADFIQEHEIIGNIYENPELLNEVVK